jgi:hypothetical protein
VLGPGATWNVAFTGVGLVPGTIGAGYFSGTATDQAGLGNDGIAAVVDTVNTTLVGTRQSPHGICCARGMIIGEANTTRRPEMTCHESAEFLMDYLDGSLSEPERRSFEEHLGECPDCVAYLQTYQETIRLGKEACTSGDDSIPPNVPEDLVRAILAARRR